jgi:hypothetical protein
VKYRRLGWAGHASCVILQGNYQELHEKTSKNNHLKDYEAEKHKQR